MPEHSQRVARDPRNFNDLIAVRSTNKRQAP